MGSHTDRLWPDRPLVVGSYAVVLLLVFALFASVFPAYVTAETVYRIETTDTEYAIRDGGETLQVDVTLFNPTNHPVDVSSMASSANLHVYRNGTRLSHATSTAIDGGRIPAGGTGTVTATFRITPPHREDLGAAIESGKVRLRGELVSRVVDRRVSVKVDRILGADDG